MAARKTKKRRAAPKKRTHAHHSTATHRAHKRAPARLRGNPGRKRARRNPRRRRGGFLGFRNPTFNSGLIMEGIGLAAGSALTAFTVSLIPTSLGGTSMTADLIRTGAAAWLLGELAKMFGMPRLGRVITLGGVALLGGKLIYGLIIPTATDVFKPKQPAAMPGKGMSAVVAVPSGQYDAYYGSTPLAAPRRAVAANGGGNAMTRAAAATTRSGVGAVWTGRMRY